MDGIKLLRRVMNDTNCCTSPLIINNFRNISISLISNYLLDEIIKETDNFFLRRCITHPTLLEYQIRST